MKNDEENILRYLSTLSDVLKEVPRDLIQRFIDLLRNTAREGATVFVFGNGGSGSNASHFCADLVKGVSEGRQRRFRALCLNDNMPAFSAIANDRCYEDVFIEQLRNFLGKEDVVVGISGSGNSENVLRAIRYARDAGASTVALSGFDGGELLRMADFALHVPVNDMEIVEDVHSMILHCIKSVLRRDSID